MLTFGFLKRFIQHDRNSKKDQISVMGYDSSITVKNIAEDIKKGGKINKPVQLTVYNGTALLTDGNHRIAALEKAGVSDNYEVPTKIFIKGKLRGRFAEFKNQFKKITI